jgi:hypothetical protein
VLKLTCTATKHKKALMSMDSILRLDIWITGSRVQQ